MVSETFSETLGVLLKGIGNDSDTLGDALRSEPLGGIPRVDCNPPSDEQYAEIDTAIGELDGILVSLNAGREARRAAATMMWRFFEKRRSSQPAQLISAALGGDTAKQPETFQYDEEPFDFVSRHALLDGRNVVNVRRQKQPAHRPRDPRVGDRKVHVVEAYQQLRTNPDLKKEEIHRHLATTFCISVSYVRQILRIARKVGAL